MTHSDSVIKWIGSLKGQPIIRDPGDRIVLSELVAVLAVLDPYWLSSLIVDAYNQQAQLLWMSGRPSLIGVLFVCMCAVAVLAVRVAHVRQELERSAAELRTKREELRRFQRNAEKLAEIVMLEERSRIAHEIHDAVGHTLTAAIVQLEATRRIVEQRNCVPLDKLDLLDEIVRKGLDDIRKAVKLMSSDEIGTFAIEETLRKLVQYTQDTMEIAIEADISLPMGQDLGRLTEQALYQALQEGLTNGIRHGRCTRACFSLQSSDGILRFRLINNGEPYGTAVPGFGLSAMMERVKLLGGRVNVRSSADADGNPVGCELSIDLPLAG